MPRRVLAALIISLLAQSAYSAGQPNTYTLTWAEKSEQLTYRSCGCADGCWIAELRERKSKRLKASLRCDCSNLLGRYPAKTPEIEFKKSCSLIHDREDKMDAISQTMKSLVDRDASKK
jgi:hypothetical protein